MLDIWKESMEPVGYRINRFLEEPPKKSRQTPERRLRGRLWFSYVLHSQEWDVNEFADQGIRNSLDYHRLVPKWESGKLVPDYTSAKELEADRPGTIWAFELPLFPLLANKELSVREIWRLMRPYMTGESLPYWSFPNDKTRDHEITILKEDSQGLFQQGDIYGFMAILSLVRESETLRDTDMHLAHLANLFRAVPAIGKLPWIKPHVPLLRECLEIISSRRPSALVDIRVDWDVIQKQIEDPEFSPNRELRPWRPNTGRFLDIEDPVSVRIG